MSRRNVFDLSTAIDKYKESKDKENALKKANNELNENIKTLYNYIFMCYNTNILKEVI